MTIEGLRELLEVGVARIEPAGAGKAIPVALRDDVCSGMECGEVRRDDAIVAGQDGRDAQAAQHGDELLRRAARFCISSSEMGSSKQHMLPMSCQF